MNKDDILKIGVVILAISFITELFFLGGSSFFANRTTVTAENMSGTTTFTGTIRTYDPLLAVPSATDKLILDDVRKRPEVSSVTQQGSYLLIRTDTRDDVFPLASYLRSRNVSSISIANIALPTILEINTGTNKTNITSNGGIVRVETQPILDVDSEVDVSMIAVATTDGRLIDYQNPQILAKDLKLSANATITKLAQVVYSYQIPWEGRVIVKSYLDGNSSGYTYKYTQNDNILFQTPLTIDQIMIKRQFDYITYVDANSATVSPVFDNRTQVEANFEDVKPVFPASVLTVTGNSADFTSPVPFNSTVAYGYAVALPMNVSGYTISDSNETMIYNSATNRSLGDTVQVNISAVAIGGRLFTVTLS